MCCAHALVEDTGHVVDGKCLRLLMKETLMEGIQIELLELVQKQISF